MPRNSDRIRVHVVKYAGKRRGLQLRWKDRSGKWHTQATDCTRRRDASTLADKKEEELNASDVVAENGRITFGDWSDLVKAYYLPGLEKSTVTQMGSHLSVFRRKIDPKFIADITAHTLSRYATALRKDGRREATVQAHLRTFRALLRWSVDQGYISVVPKFPRAARGTKQKKHRGRPLTDAEFAKMLESVDAAVEPGCGDSWRHLLRGLWLSGLRISEAISLSWEPSNGVYVDIPDDGSVRLVFKKQKSGREQIAPIATDFGKFLLATPEADRTGFVFNPLVRYGHRVANSRQATRFISAIGEAAAIKTDSGFATAHDLRRSFGLRWAKLVKPFVLKGMMRHESVLTTEQYYATAEADHWADEINRAWEQENRRNNRETPKNKGDEA